MTWYANNPSILRRWAALSEEPLPESFAQYAAQFTAHALRIKSLDPELVSVLDGTCSAGIKADVLENKFPPTAPSAEQRQEEALTAEAQALYASKPFETGNLTDQMRLRMLNPELASQQEAAATPDPGRPDLSEAQRAAAAAEEERVRKASIEKGWAQSAAIYNRARIRREMLEAHQNDLRRIGGQGDD